MAASGSANPSLLDRPLGQNTNGRMGAVGRGTPDKTRCPNPRGFSTFYVGSVRSTCRAKCSPCRVIALAAEHPICPSFSGEGSTFGPAVCARVFGTGRGGIAMMTWKDVPDPRDDTCPCVARCEVTVEERTWRHIAERHVVPGVEPWDEWISPAVANRFRKSWSLGSSDEDRQSTLDAIAAVVEDDVKKCLNVPL